jgi:hypothetical protein
VVVAPVETCAATSAMLTPQASAAARSVAVVMWRPPPWS